MRLLTGLVEISSGVWSLAGAGTLTGRVSMAAFMLGWAGLSVHCQVLSFLADSGLSTRTYILGKLLHGGLSALLVGALARLWPLEQPVAGYLAEQVESIALLDFSSVLAVSAVAAWLLWLGFLPPPCWSAGAGRISPKENKNMSCKAEGSMLYYLHYRSDAGVVQW